MGFWFLPLSRGVSEGNPFEDVHGAEQPHVMVLPLHHPPLCMHNTQLLTHAHTQHTQQTAIYIFKQYLCHWFNKNWSLFLS